jgi:hypothetical protein
MRALVCLELFNITLRTRCCSNTKYLLCNTTCHIYQHGRNFQGVSFMKDMTLALYRRCTVPHTLGTECIQIVAEVAPLGPEGITCIMMRSKFKVTQISTVLKKLRDNSLNRVSVLNGVIASHSINFIRDNTKIPSTNGKVRRKSLAALFQKLEHHFTKKLLVLLVKLIFVITNLINIISFIFIQ